MEIDADPGASAFLVVSGRSAPLVLNAVVVAQENGRLVLDLVESPLPVSPTASDTSARLEVTADRRGLARYPTWIDARVYSHAFPNGQPSVITDLSEVGASVEVDEWDNDQFFRLSFEVHGEVLHIECEAVQHEPTWRGVLVHTRFVLLSPEQNQVLENLVDALRSVFGEAQESLAADRRGVIHA
jgi:hypothetical protein